MQLPDWWKQAITVTLAAQAYNMSRTWIHDLISKYNVPHFRIGNVVYVKRDDLEAIINDKGKRIPRLDGD